jgi:hypothetical protein
MRYRLIRSWWRQPLEEASVGNMIEGQGVRHEPKSARRLVARRKAAPSTPSRERDG